MEGKIIIEERVHYFGVPSFVPLTKDDGMAWEFPLDQEEAAKEIFCNLATPVKCLRLVAIIGYREN